MSTTIKRPFKTFNGADWDTHHFETSEDMLVGMVQSLGSTGYRKLPGGLIVQWGIGTVRISKNADGYSGEAAVTFPIVFPSCCIYAHAMSKARNTYSTAAYGLDVVSPTGFKPQFWSFNGTDANFVWVAIGY